ncbi:hypothetical protein BTA51_27010 [Hahella sp. CCB-MM4]|uniref:4'-phosphopantetheinyl transferase family protein n=1 Tax=Hahella sp. (strain CCB-MM4) TaxID=1926491 RepID=UPI000B9ADD29|nr:4'-phosphopantetheinyl transferase superfamily protein [Hahella sp. CCB-MM4]OZG70252.1 hypothetical protein BTA51_27010 [Hahella sp. CCB-MM4]
MFPKTIHTLPCDLPEDNHVVVVSADLDGFTEAEQALYHSWLTPRESARVNAIKFPEAAQCSLLGRAIVRAVAAQWRHTSPDLVEISYQESGKPVLDSVGNSSLHFSITHHRNQVAVTFARNPLGVDLESPMQEDKIKLARRYFVPQETEFMEAHKGQERNEYFTWLWTLKEAEVKRIGGAMAHVMGKAGFEFLPPEGAAGIKAIRRIGHPEDSTSYQLYRTQVGMLLSLACSTPFITGTNLWIGRPNTGYQHSVPSLLAQT